MQLVISMRRALGAFVVSCGFAAAAFAQPMTVTTIAGSTSGGGYVDAAGEEARFSFPHGVAIDRDGNVFVSDRGNHVIRRITPAGEVTTFAGTAGLSGSADGAGAAARFYHPAGLAVDLATNILYVADSWNHTIRAVSPEGVVTTVAGTARAFGTADGVGSAARFSYPQGLAVDASGFIWVADTSNHRIRRIVGQTVTTFATGFNFPFDVAVDRNGDLYVADTENNAIVKVTREGVQSTIAGDPFEADLVDGNLQTARFDSPWGVEVAPNGDIYVADYGNNAIRRITVGGAVTTVAGSPAGSSGTRNGLGTQARFTQPTGLAFDSAGRLYVADRANQAIRRMPLTTFDVTTFAGSRPVSGSTDGRGTAARFFYPEAAVSDGAGNLYLADGHAIRKITPDGVVTTLAGTSTATGSADGTGAAARFLAPSGLAMDSAGVLWVADTGNNTIRKVTLDGVVSTVAGVPGVPGKADGVGTQARFDGPWGLAFDNAGNLYVADSGNHLIRIMSPGGVVTAFAGSGSAGSSDSTTALFASFRFPLGVTTDTAGNVYVADWGNHTIRKISGGRVTTLAGSAGTADSTDGTGTTARFDNPRSIAADRNGTLFVADTDNHTIRRVTPAGVVTTVAGRAGNPGNVDGTGSSARLFWPNGVALDSSGAVIIVDTYNHAVKRATFAAPAVVQFTATPQAVKSAQTVTLAWQVGDATSVSIDHGIGAVTATGTRAVTVTETTTFTLTATGLGGSVTARVTVYVGLGKRRTARH
jgi:sugar lactone lactonase YvrE